MFLPSGTWESNLHGTLILGEECPKEKNADQFCFVLFLMENENSSKALGRNVNYCLLNSNHYECPSKK